MQHEVPTWKIYTENWQYNPAGTLTRSWLKLVGEDHVNHDIYPFHGGQPYFGKDYQTVGVWPSGPLGIWNMYLSWVRGEVADESKDFWIVLQAHDDGTYLRMPTPSELACETFMALAWGAMGLNYYFYQWPSVGNGIIDTRGRPTSLYYELRNHIGPYIQAADKFYMPLEWDSCYVFSPTTTGPSGCYVHSITAKSGSENPDLGWFQVGQFTKDNTSDKYVMLVNRACNTNGNTIAPPVTAKIKFDALSLNLGNYVLITDLANSLTKPCSTCDWVGVRRTTYSSKSPDGTIPYTITLQAGEGKLLKISRAGSYKR
jgi:hypothetical protein